MGAESAEAKIDRLVGTIIQDRFLVVERIAAGGMGVVYKAEQVPLGRAVALKILESKHNEQVDSHFSERFFLEAAAVAKLSHPNTIVLYDYGRTDDSLYYYAMEYVDGTTLTKRIYDHGPMSPREAIHVAMQIAGSLRDAHEQGMVHRDLKPGNVMLTSKGGDPSFVKVLDFGLVKVMGQDVGVELTKSGMLMGSPRYMAPEQVTGRPVDNRADIYSLGSVLYHALTGAPPFQQESQYEVLRAQVESAPPSLRATFPECQASPALEAFVMHCLGKKPDQRPESMNDVLRALTDCAREAGDDDISINSSLRPLGPRSGEAPTPSISIEQPGSWGGSPEPSASGPVAVAPAAAAPAVDAAPAAAAASVAPPPTAAAPAPAGGLGGKLAGAAVLLAVIALAVGAAFMIPTGRQGEDPAPPPVADAPDPPGAHAGPVRVRSEPAGARVRRGDEDLGDTPVTLRVPAGDRWEVTLGLEGYESRTVTVSAGRGDVDVRLRPVPAAEPAVEPTAGSRTPSRRGRRGRAGAAAAEPAPAGASETPSTSASSSDTTAERTPEEGWGTRRTDNRDPWAQ